MIGEPTFTATVRYDADGVKIRVTASRTYFDRSVQVDTMVEDQELSGDIAGALDRAVESVRDELAVESMSAAAQALVIATKNKEPLSVERAEVEEV